MSRAMFTRNLRLTSSALNTTSFINKPLNRFHTSVKMASNKLNSETISNITAREKEITGQDEPARKGPTAAAQSHNKETISSQAVHDITEGEKKVSGMDAPVSGGPAAYAQSQATQAQAGGAHASGKLDSETISHITSAEKDLTGQDNPVKKGPTARAQQHAGEPITGQALHDITEGEKKVTGGERVAGGPTAAAQSELAKSRQ